MVDDIVVGVVGSRHFAAIPKDPAHPMEGNNVSYEAGIRMVQWVLVNVTTKFPHAIICTGCEYDREARRAYDVDAWAANTAEDLGLRAKLFPAKWLHYGKGAGFARNRLIVEHSSLVIAFWDGRSRGAEHCIGLAREAGKLRSIYYPDGSVEQFKLGGKA
jgi:hypothetical protein